MAFPSPNASRPYQLIKYANNVTNEAFGVVILLVVFTIAYTSMSKYASEKAFAGAIYLTMILAILFRVLSIVGDQVVFICIIIAVLALLFNYFKK